MTKSIAFAEEIGVRELTTAELGVVSGGGWQTNGPDGPGYYGGGGSWSITGHKENGVWTVRWQQHF